MAANRGFVSPKDFGAVGDCVRDDTAAFKAALTASVGKTLALGPYCYNLASLAGPMNPKGQVNIVGVGGNPYGATQISEIKYPANTSLLQLAYNSAVKNVYIYAGAGGASTSGAAIDMVGNPTGVVVVDNWIVGACNAIAINGPLSTVTGNNVSGSNAGACRPYTIGATATPSYTYNTYFVHNTVSEGALTPAGLTIYDSSGLFMIANSMSLGIDGTDVTPGPGQTVIATTSAENYYGDTMSGVGLKINPSAPGGRVASWTGTDNWVSNEQGVAPLSYIENINGGVVEDVQEKGFRAFGSANYNIEIGANTTGVSFVAPLVCGIGAAGIQLDPGAGHFQIMGGGKIATICGGVPKVYKGVVGITSQSANPDVTVGGVDMTGVAVPLNPTRPGYGPSANSVVTAMAGVDTELPSIASSSTIALPINPVVAISGRTAISTINGYWNGRHARLVTTAGAVTLSTGGNICNSASSAGANKQIDLIYAPAAHCWLASALP